jgi:DNA-binding Lrp family transcriptional regulator
MLGGSIPGSRQLTTMRLRLDATDWRILKHLQGDARISNVELARRVGLSPAPCLRRVRALEEAGVLEAFHAVLDGAAVGWPVTAFALVGLVAQAEADLRAFEDRLLRWPSVREAHMLSGDCDYALKCVAPDLAHFQAFVLEELTAAPNVASVRTYVTIRRVKLEAGVPVALGGGPAARAAGREPTDAGR